MNTKQTLEMQPRQTAQASRGTSALRHSLTAAILLAPFQLYAQEQAPPAAPTPTAVMTKSASEPAPEPSTPATRVSQVRIVRLSQVNGNVVLDRGNGQKSEAAFVNLPIVAGERLETQDGLAEVEFEDNSSVRLTPHTVVEFPVLERNAAGFTNSSIKLISGSLYASMVKSKGADLYSVHVGNRTIGLAPASHLRIDAASATAATLTVFKGDVPVSGANAQLVINKKKSLAFDPSSQAQPTLARAAEEPAPYDAWDKNATDYHSARVSSALVGSAYSYGLNDLSYYGAFSDAGGCGSLWRPYLVSSAWDPYGSGVWSYYGGSGYSWVSPYPWGWTPFHSGSWQYCGNSGWGWRPQAGSWNGLLNQPPVRSINGPHLPRPVAPHPPAPGQPTLVPVNLKSIPVSRPGTDGAFAFRGDSAGLGVPRGVFNNLGKLSHTAEQHSFAPTPIRENQLRPGVVLANSPAQGNRSGGANQTSFRSESNSNSHVAQSGRTGGSNEGAHNASFSNASRVSAPSQSYSSPQSHSAPSMSAPSMSAPSSSPAAATSSHK